MTVSVDFREYPCIRKLIYPFPCKRRRRKKIWTIAMVGLWWEEGGGGCMSLEVNIWLRNWNFSYTDRGDYSSFLFDFPRSLPPPPQLPNRIKTISQFANYFSKYQKNYFGSERHGQLAVVPSFAILFMFFLYFIFFVVG